MGECYSQNAIINIRFTYVIMILVWTLLIAFFQLYYILAGIVLIIPYILFGLAISKAESFVLYGEHNSGRETYITIVFILALSFTAYIEKMYGNGIKNIWTIMLIILILATLSLIPIWTDKMGECVWKHCRTAFEVMAFTLLIYIFMSYILEK